MRMEVGTAIIGAILEVGVEGEDVVSVAVGEEDIMDLILMQSKMEATITKHLLKAVVGHFPLAVYIILLKPKVP